MEGWKRRDRDRENEARRDGKVRQQGEWMDRNGRNGDGRDTGEEIVMERKKKGEIESKERYIR